jgi:hypothetical protein
MNINFCYDYNHIKSRYELWKVKIFLNQCSLFTKYGKIIDHLYRALAATSKIYIKYRISLNAGKLDWNFTVINDKDWQNCLLGSGRNTKLTSAVLATAMFYCHHCQFNVFF